VFLNSSVAVLRNDEPRPEQPRTPTRPEIMDKIQDVVLANRRIKAHEIAKAVRMSYERVFDLKKPSAQSGAETRSSSNTS
jgi:hypothetical protein